MAFHPCKRGSGATIHTASKTITTNTTTDLGEIHNYRYIETNTKVTRVALLSNVSTASTTVSCKSYKGWQNFTNNNFCMHTYNKKVDAADTNYQYFSGSTSSYKRNYYKGSLSYNASTGVLTVTGPYFTGYETYQSSGKDKTTRFPYYVYLYYVN